MKDSPRDHPTIVEVLAAYVWGRTWFGDPDDELSEEEIPPLDNVV